MYPFRFREQNYVYNIYEKCTSIVHLECHWVQTPDTILPSCLNFKSLKLNYKKTLGRVPALIYLYLF